MRQRGVGLVQIVCAAEVLEPLHRHRGVEAVHFGRLDQCKVDAKRVHILDRLLEVARLSQDGNRANAAFGARAVRLHQRIRQEHPEVVPMVHVVGHGGSDRRLANHRLESPAVAFHDEILGQMPHHRVHMVHQFGRRGASTFLHTFEPFGLALIGTAREPFLEAVDFQHRGDDRAYEIGGLVLQEPFLHLVDGACNQVVTFPLRFEQGLVEGGN